MSSPGPIIVALDFADAGAALAFAGTLDPARCRVKVGKELFVRAGPAVIDSLHELGFEVFLDLKFHDIPNTVAGACRAAAERGVWMLNVHACGGRRMMAAAREAVDRAARPPLLIAVTVLTSLERADFAEIGIEPGAVVRLARLADDSGMDGVVCSAADLAGLADLVRADFARVTPGIRPSGAEVGDQRRVATPAAALAAGASHLVIGRPITASADPASALAAIEAEIAGIPGALTTAS